MNFFVIAYFDKNLLLAMANVTHYTAYKAVKRDLVYINLNCIAEIQYMD